MPRTAPRASTCSPGSSSSDIPGTVEPSPGRRHPFEYPGEDTQAPRPRPMNRRRREHPDPCPGIERHSKRRMSIPAINTLFFAAARPQLHSSRTAVSDPDPIALDNDRHLACSSRMFQHFLKSRLICGNIDILRPCSISRPGFICKGSSPFSVNDYLFCHSRTSHSKKLTHAAGWYFSGSRNNVTGFLIGLLCDFVHSPIGVHF